MKHAAAFTLILIATATILAAETAGTERESLEDLPDPGITHLAGERVEVEIDVSSGRPMADLTIDGQGPFRFVVDTGASFSLIDEAIAQNLGLEVVGEQRIQSPGASEEIRGGRVRVSRVEAEGLRIENPVLATMDLAGFSAGTIDGVLGRPHFRELLLTFDYPASRLTVSKGRLERSDTANLEFDLEAGHIGFSLGVAGVTVPVVLDTGSPGGFTLPKDFEPRLSFVSAPVPGHTIQLVGGVHPTWRGTLVGDVQLADIRYESPEVVLTTISDEFGNIGFEVLRELRVTLDQASGLVRFVREEPTPSEAPVRRVVRRAGPMKIGGPAGTPRLGVAFEMTLSGFVKKDGGLVVRHVDEGGAADLAGLAVGDIVISVGGAPLAELGRATEIGTLLRGPRPLALAVVRGGKQLEIVVE